MKIFLGPAGIPMSCDFNSSIEGVKKVSELGLTAMETPFTHGIHMTLDTAKKLGKAATENDVELSIHAPYFINFASEDKRIIEDSKKRIMDSLERGVAMGATVVVAHAGYYGKDKEQANEMVFKACKEIDENIERNGWKINFGLETMGKQKSWGTLEEIIEVSKRLKSIIPYIDAAHIYARNGGNANFKEVFDKLENLKLKKYHCHFSGIKYSLLGIGMGNEIKHVPMKEAGPDFEEFAKELLKRKIDMTIISESPLLEMDSLLMKTVLEELGYKF
jgi:deoxyribonuclease IV